MFAAIFALVLFAGVGVPGVWGSPPHQPGGIPPGSSTDAAVTGIATFAAAPTPAQVQAARGLGLAVQPMERLPLAIVRGPDAALDALVGLGVARAVYPDEPVELYDTASADAMGTARPRAAGLTGEGTTVAVVDSGCDATHPDLADHVEHNVKLVGGEHANQTPTPQNTLVVPLDAGPVSNSDLTSGHGTHVAGIVAADGTTSPDHLGVAPDAGLVCYGIGDALFTTAVVTAYDHLLRQPDLWGVDVVNNSWGNPYAQFDPRHPVNVATKAVADLGVVVVFAAGNSGSDRAEMTLNQFALAPWVISVAAATLDGGRGEFSSNGQRYDNAEPAPIGPGGYTVFKGSRLGIHHPDVTAPGVDVSSTCAKTGLTVGPCPTPDNTTASGTSMASPHVAGAAAVLRQARPELTVAQVRTALQSTAVPIGEFWETGYGFVDLASAVELVGSEGYEQELARRQAQADERVLAAKPPVRRSDLWMYPAPLVTVRGVPDTRTFSTDVPASVPALKVTLAYPSLATVGAEGAEYSVTVRDAAGAVLGTTTAVPAAGSAGLLLDLAGRSVAYGPFTFEVRGELAVSDPDTVDSESVLGRWVTLQVAQAA